MEYFLIARVHMEAYHLPIFFVLWTDLRTSLATNIINFLDNYKTVT